ncbi:hypothetical protein [Novosphingobium sp.]|uniref:hypothetical protein n=1 Tax=Novosphingobium sp. TaxID=1874826 RepID=UPI0025CCFFAB|nr:hypothetical protein [Novosphingobium sp.]MCC6926499.1 hypothetical protein [Novosphingobium sp.]
MRYPSDVQVAVLYDREVTQLRQIVTMFLEHEQRDHGVRYNPIEIKEDCFYQYFGTNDLMITFEHVQGQASAAAFAQTLASPVTRLTVPEAEGIIASHRSHVLINVSHSAMGGREIQAMLAQMGVDLPGNTYATFVRRLDYAARLGSLALRLPGAALVHWTLSNQLYSPAMFKELAKAGVPSPLHVHPYLFGQRGPGGEELAGIRTFGVQHFLGREVEIEPSVLPWVANYENILVFMRVALADNGYVIPDGDTFGNESRTISYRVEHLPQQDGQVGLYRLEPLLHREFGFQSPDYVPDERRIDHARPPIDLMPANPAERADLLGEWRAKESMARGIGGSFEVRARGEDPIPPPPPPGGNRLGRIFGRKAG